MDKEQLKNSFTAAGYTWDKGKTKEDLCTTAETKSFLDVKQSTLTNRQNSVWKTARYIIVDDCDEKKLETLLEKWRLLTKNYSNQHLLVYNAKKDGYDLYDSNGIKVCDDSELDKIIGSDSKKTAGQIGENIIYYGVPGCGKSHKVKEKYQTVEGRYERVVFHPDYTNADFVGQIIPEVKIDKKTGEKHITYDYKEGPFTRILKKAHADKDPEHMYYLIIEEINRGNAAAIFGEIIQLLDRENGESEYGISNAFIAGKVYGNEEELVKLPKNLTIVATMNTADQNVFTLDTAFKRRWHMVSIPDEIKECKYRDYEIAGTGVTWEYFHDTVNKRIVEEKESYGNNDKRLGAFFASKEDIKDVERFAEKVIMYLWDDAFKNSRDSVFDYHDEKTLEDVISDFKKYKFGVFKKSLGLDNYSSGDAELETDDNEHKEDY